MTRNRPLCRILTAAAACATSLIAHPAQAESWSSIAYIPNTHVTVSFDRTSIEKDHGLTRAWYLFTYATPITTAESFVLRSYKQHEIVDCKRQGSFTESFVAYSDADGEGRVIYTWSRPNAVLPPLQPAVPGGVRAIMIDAACSPAPKPVPVPPPAPAAGVAAGTAPAIANPAPSRVEHIP